LASAFVVETMAATGKVLKIVCTPFINMPKAFARTEEDISKIDKFLKEKLEPEVLTKILKMKESYITNFLKPTNTVEFSVQDNPVGYSVYTNEGRMAASKAALKPYTPDVYNSQIEPTSTDYHSGDDNPLSFTQKTSEPRSKGGKKHTKKKRYYKSKRI
jgi:hypothetical protein